MDVRKIVKTTISLTVLAAGFVFFRLYYVKLLSWLLNRIYKDEIYYSLITVKLFPSFFIGGYFPSLFYISVIAVLSARFIDAILSHKYALNVLSSFKQPLILTAIATIALSIDRLNILQLWGIFYFLLLICLHSTFKIIVSQSEFYREYPPLKLFKNFVLAIKSIIQNVIFNGFGSFEKPADETVVLSISGVILLLETTVLISFIVYMAKYWRLIFLAHLISLG